MTLTNDIVELTITSADITLDTDGQMPLKALLHQGQIQDFRKGGGGSCHLTTKTRCIFFPSL